eukprot:SAG11_NODE_994_length_6261_cov_10.558747_7_plen_122_part_00
MLRDITTGEDTTHAVDDGSIVTVVRQDSVDSLVRLASGAEGLLKTEEVRSMWKYKEENGPNHPKNKYMEVDVAEGTNWKFGTKVEITCPPNVRPAGFFSSTAWGLTLRRRRLSIRTRICMR